MHDDMRQVVDSVDGIASVHDVRQLEALERSMERFFTLPEAVRHLAVWFRLFERFPEDDAYEMFWSVLHGIEGQPGFEPHVVESVRRRPSRFPIMMVNRMLNACQSQVGGPDLLTLLRSVADNASCPPSVREDARRFVEYQEERG